MGLLQRYRDKKQARLIAGQLAEESVYEAIGYELASGRISRGLWVKAMAASRSHDDRDIEKEYIKLRAEHYMSGAVTFQKLLEELGEEPEDDEIPSEEPGKMDHYTKEGVMFLVALVIIIILARIYG